MKKAISLFLAIVLCFGTMATLSAVCYAEKTEKCAECSFEDIQVVPATCEGEGYTIHKCTVCGYEEQYNFQEALGHSDEDDNGVCDNCEEVLLIYYIKAMFNELLKFIMKMIGIA